MKAFSAILIVLASVGLADAADFCAPQSKSCIKLPQASAKVCSSLICMNLQKNVWSKILTFPQPKPV
jgi:hypothetical protein